MTALPHSHQILSAVQQPTMFVLPLVLPISTSHFLKQIPTRSPTTGHSVTLMPMYVRPTYAICAIAIVIPAPTSTTSLVLLALLDFSNGSNMVIVADTFVKRGVFLWVVWLEIC